MLLAIDTSTRWTGLALHDGNAIVAEMGWSANNTQTVELAPAVQELLRKTGCKVTQIAAVGVAMGPGSYTGLRIGFGLAKGLALANGLPLIGIPTMDIVVAAFGAAEENQLIIAVDAGRERVAAATYRWYSRKGWQVKKSADLYTWPQLIAEAKEGSYFAGELSPQARKMLKDADKQLRAVSPAFGARRAGYLAELAYLRWRKNDVDDPAALVPIYLREPGSQNG